MKKFLGLAVLTAAMTISASAATELVACQSWSDSVGSGTFGIGLIQAGTLACPGVGTLPVGDTFSNFQLVLQTDYTGGTLGSTNTIQTVYAISPAVGGFAGDTLTSTSAPGTGPSETYTCTVAGCAVYSPGGASYFTENTTISSLPTSSFNVTYTSSVTAGTVQGASGQVYELVTYSTSAPEPMTLSLMGVGLLGMGLMRRRFSKR